MSATIPGWTPELERSFKEVLFRFLEEVQSTKAALYLLAPDGSYALATQYGFRGMDLLAKSHVANDVLVIKAVELNGSPLVSNDVRRVPELADYVVGAGTERILLLPLTAAGRLIGFVDARDKGRKRPFEEGDLEKSSSIAGAMIDLIVRSRLYPGLKVAPEPAEAPAPTPSPVPERPAAPAAIPVAAAPRESVPTGVFDVRSLGQLYDQARSAAHRSDIVAIALTVTDDLSGATLVLVGKLSGEVDAAALMMHQSEALQQLGLPAPHPRSWRFETSRLSDVGDPAPARLIASRVLLSTGGSAVTCSVVGVMGSSAAAECLDHLSTVADNVSELVSLRMSRRQMARRILEPSEGDFPELCAHSVAVSRLCWSMARHLDLSVNQAEEAALAGLLHDVGMRELNYEDIYQLHAPGADDRAEYKRHAEVGEKLVASAGLSAIAPAVRHHHERWDGTGYPDRLAGQGIPFLARLVHVAEVFDVMTSPSSYRRPMSAASAIDAMKTAAETQFDPTMIDLISRIAE